MPTAAKFVAAVFFAMLGYFMALAYRPTLPEGMQVGLFAEISAGIGLLCGWLIMGNRAGKGYGRAWGMGIRTALTTVVYAVLLFSIAEMIDRSVAGRYGGSPMDALVAAIALVLEYGTNMLDQTFILTVLLGGAIGGLIVEWSSRRWT